MKAVALLSGGLDSTLAVKVVMEQGIEVEAVHFVSVVATCTAQGGRGLASGKAAKDLGIPLRVFNVSKDFLALVKDPKHGYGSNMNPCIDCRIFMLERGKAYMKSSGASFIITGEVLGQRPMSQRRDAMNLTEKKAGLGGLILRPLSAKFLPPTIPEKEGWVDREKLLGIHGRSRKEQMRLAAQLGIREYPTPAGGCLLTDPGFARRLRDLMDHRPGFSVNDIHLLKIGRHFRFSPATKMIVGRNEEENRKICTFAKSEDILLKLTSFPGPVSLLRGEANEAEVEKAAAITVRYSKAKGLGKVEVSWRTCSEDSIQSLMVSSPPEHNIKAWIID